MDTEFALFERLPNETEGMFDPAYPSLYEAFRAVGVRTFDDAVREASRMQYAPSPDTAIPPHIRHHPAFTGGVAVTLLRQSAWAEHDREWARLNWHHQREHARLLTVWNTLWTPDGHRSVFERHKDYAANLIRYGETHRFAYDDQAHVTRLTLNLRRTSTVLLAHHVNGADAPYMGPLNSPNAVLDHHRTFIERLEHRDPPMPLWNLATEFHTFRTNWEARLKAATQVQPSTSPAYPR